MNRPLRSVLILLLLSAAPLSVPADQSVNGLPFADEYVWRSDYYAEWAGGLSYVELFRQAVSQAEQATALMQGVTAEGDLACPVRFAHRRVLPFRAEWPEFETIEDISFRIAPGVHLYSAPGGSKALTPGDTAKVALGPGLARRGGWILAHEIGHNVGLDHEPQSLMSGSGENGRTVLAAQCEAFLAATVLEGKSRCLLFDTALESQGLWPYVAAPRLTPCSDGSGYCDANGRCVPTRLQCVNASIGSDCSASGFCGACTGWSARCVACDTSRGLTQLGVCGNGVPETGEECDDGNYYSGDGCNAWCRLSEVAPEFSADSDGDGLQDYRDRCPALATPDQSDLDGDGMGDRCDHCVAEPHFDPTVPCEGDADEDGDGLANFFDNCPGVFEPSRADDDGDFVGNACDICRVAANPGQVDRNRDGIGDQCQCGDVIPDGYLTSSDVNCLMACVLGSAPTNCHCGEERADTQNDGRLGFEDASRLSAALRGQIPVSELTCGLRPTNEQP